MVKLLSIISLILALVLFPPAALAVISNNAVPGDSTYPIKRSLEDVIFAVASVNPTTKAWFSAARSDRRFTEFKTLVAQGKKGADTLNELVEQTSVAANQIAQVTDSTEKAKLIEQLSKSIEKYDQGLKQVTSLSIVSSSPTRSTSNPASDDTSVTSGSNPQVTALPSIRPEVQPTVRARPTVPPATQPTTQPTPTPTPTVQSTPQSTPRPTLSPKPTPIAVSNQQKEEEKQRQREIDEARKRLEEINKRLHQESTQLPSNSIQTTNNGNTPDRKVGRSTDKKDNNEQN